MRRTLILSFHPHTDGAVIFSLDSLSSFLIYGWIHWILWLLVDLRAAASVLLRSPGPTDTQTPKLCTCWWLHLMSGQGWAQRHRVVQRISGDLNPLHEFTWCGWWSTDVPLQRLQPGPVLDHKPLTQWTVWHVDGGHAARLLHCDWELNFVVQPCGMFVHHRVK